MTLELTSPAFQQGEPIPRPYSKDGHNISPPLHWTEPPTGTRSLALLCEDPDAPRGIFTHWVLFNVPADVRKLPEGVPTQARLGDGTVQGTNDFGAVGYGGPAPPRGKPHRYFFKLHALDQVLNLQPSTTRAQLLAAMAGHILEEAEVMGTYER